MSQKPKYYYELSIYGPEKNENNVKPVYKEPGWYVPIGVGKKLVSLFHTSKTTAGNLAAKGGDLLEYSSSLEGKVKLGVIGTSACVGGIVALTLRPKGWIRKLLYPTALIGASSAVCYPSTAYAVSKIVAVKTYNGGTTAYDFSKVAKNRVGKWMDARRNSLESEQTEKSFSEMENIPLLQEPADLDKAPIRNPPVFEDITVKEENDSSTSPPETKSTEEAETTNIVEQTYQIPTSKELLGPITANILSDEETPNDSIQDMGQSSQEDKDLYTTRQ